MSREAATAGTDSRATYWFDREITSKGSMEKWSQSTFQSCGLLGIVNGCTHKHTSLLCKKPSVEKGKRVGERGRSKRGLWEWEAGGKRKEVWNKSRGTPDCCYPTCSQSTGAGRLSDCCCCRRRGCKIHTPKHTNCRGRVTIVTHWPRP